MGCPIKFDKVKVSIGHIGGPQDIFSKNDNIIFLSITQLKPSVLFVGHRQTVQKKIQTPHNAASDQGLHCLLTENSIRI